MDKVRPTVAVLTAGGHAVWFDDRLLPGQPWKPVLGEEIARCDAFVYAATTETVRSEWCAWELATAARLEKAVIPVLLEPGVSVPAPLDQLQCADFSEGVTGTEVAKLMLALDNLQKIPVAASPPLPADPKGVPSRAWDSVEHWMDAAVTPVYEPQNEAEEIVEKHFALTAREREEYFGRLILTNQRVLFEIHRLPFERHRLSPFRRRWCFAIQLSAIKSVGPTRIFGIPIHGMTIRCHSGEVYRFFVWGRKRILSRIEEERKRVQRLT